MVTVSGHTDVVIDIAPLGLLVDLLAVVSVALDEVRSLNKVVELELLLDAVSASGNFPSVAKRGGSGSRLQDSGCSH